MPASDDNQEMGFSAKIATGPPEMTPPRRNVAIFIDMENLFGGYAREVNQVPITDILDDIATATKKLGIGSTIAVTRAYANWSDSRLGKYRREMMEHGVEPVQVFSFSSVVKNAADIEMVVDVLEVAADSPHVEVFVLVSGDGGFVPLVRRLHALGKYVMVATTKERAEQSTSRLLQAVADHFLVSGILLTPQPDEVGEILLPDSVPSGDISAGDITAGAATLADVAAYIKELLSAPRGSPGYVNWVDEEGRVNGALLGIQVRKRWPGLTWRSLGYKTLGELVKEHLSVELQRPSGAETTVATLPAPSPALEPVSQPIEPEVNLEWVGPEARTALHEEVRSIVAGMDFAAAVQAAGGSLKLGPVALILRSALPVKLRKWAGFSSMTLALRYCLVDTAYCVVDSEDETNELLLISRESVEREQLLGLPDVAEHELGEAHAVWDLARRTTPPLVIVEPAILRDVSEYLLESRPEGSLVDLIDSVAEALPPYYEAVQIRGALNLLRRCGLLVGPTDYLSLHAELIESAQVQAAVRSELEICLNRHGWPILAESLDEMLGVGTEWN